MDIIIVVANVPEPFSFDSDVTISHVLNELSKRTGKPVKSLSLRFAGKLLDKLEKKLSYYRIVAGCKINARIKLLPGLDCLGPFSVVPNIGVQYDMEGDPYIQMIGPPNIMATLHAITKEHEHIFQVSPKHIVTLSDDLRLLAHIPLGDGVSFRWVYPFVKTEHSTEDKIRILDASDPLIALILFGGYLYQDSNNRVIQVNGIKPGPGLYFDGPYKMNPKVFDLVYKEGRFQECTVELERCKAFCWFLPGEDNDIRREIDATPFFDDVGTPISIQHGAFGYESEDGDHRMFRISDTIPSGYFPVQEFTLLAHTETVSDEVVDSDVQSCLDPSDEVVNNDVQICVVCLEPYGDDERRRVVNKPCDHACMHHSCANQLLSASSRPQCPICRAGVIAVERMPFLS